MWIANFRPYANRVSEMQRQWESVFSTALVAPPADASDFHRHVFRELNADADSKANMGRSDGRATWCCGRLAVMPCLRVFFDGSFKDGKCGAGFVALGSCDPGPADDKWTRLAWMAFPVTGVSITAAELEASVVAQTFLVSLLRGPLEAVRFLDQWGPRQYS